uniref:DUF659 domain-containing protein n=1 Tax=Ananas comosus var. bracteatus TaxID=296719 RepID=A0A6V7PB27_ANACO|nr:unnamed protein product [Ananas comosus var. bracteatus]
MGGHGTALDEENKRVRCKYCEKVVGGFNRLKHHLGGIGSDVVECSEVPADIKEHMRNSLLEKKKERLVRQVGILDHPELPLKRSFCQLKPTQESPMEKGKRAGETVEGDYVNGKSSPHLTPPRQTSTNEGNNMKFESTFLNGHIPSSLMMEEDVKPVIKEEVRNESELLVARSVGGFFFEAGINLNMVSLPSFKKMIDVVIACGAGFKLPTENDLKGWILQQELREVLAYVQDVKQLWVHTGCSILLDSWTNERGRSLISFLVHCPHGTVFLKSMDATRVMCDSDALFLVLCNVIEEVGVQNVVQVIFHNASSYMQSAGQKVVEKYRSISCNLCADYCINDILERIAKMDHVSRVLTEAKTITSFIYGNELALELMKKHIRGGELVRASKLKSLAQFVTLENIVSERENLITMFRSTKWIASICASRDKGKRVVEKLENTSFWIAAADILKVTNPLISVLHQICESDNAPMGFLYDAMDHSKEKIKQNFGGEETRYLPIWDIIDNVWDNFLYSTIHSAAYYLNPSLFYSDGFYVDAEVTTGLLDCIARMAKDHYVIARQLEAYRTPAGCFAEPMAVDQRTSVPPALWWSLYGGQAPELTDIAVRILSQTCCCALRYKLGRGLSEQLHAEGNCLEQRLFREMEFVHNNRYLWKCASGMEETGFICEENLNLLKDWIIEDNDKR